jgi:SAM-dependent methyltransferase
LRSEWQDRTDDNPTYMCELVCRATICARAALAMPRAADLINWLAGFPAAVRDAAIEDRLGIATCAPSSIPPGEHLIGYHASGVAAIVRALAEVPVVPEDVFVDLGSGLGKVVILAALLTGATARGIEIQPALVQRAQASAVRAGVDVRFDLGDVRDAFLDDGTVFFLYAPFTGPVLTSVVDRLREIATRKAIVVCALGIDLDRASWLARRDVDAFWLSVYESSVPGAPPRSMRAASPLPANADAIVFERPSLTSIPDANALRPSANPRRMEAGSSASGSAADSLGRGYAERPQGGAPGRG